MACVLDPSYSFQWLVHDHTGSNEVKQSINDAITESIVREAETLCIGSLGLASTLPQPSSAGASQEGTLVSAEQLPIKKPRLFANYTRSKVLSTSAKSARVLVHEYLEYVEELSDCL